MVARLPLQTLTLLYLRFYRSTLSEDEMHTAILITDGGSPKTLAKHQKNIVHWINKNEGKVIVHAAAVGGKQTT